MLYLTVFSDNLYNIRQVYRFIIFNIIYHLKVKIILVGIHLFYKLFIYFYFKNHAVNLYTFIKSKGYGVVHLATSIIFFK